ncbi:MAG: hypothetical protein IPK97_08600 [Ahniella sp.]|nr:hypothetical protein [Ahniella sp.]
MARMGYPTIEELRLAEGLSGEALLELGRERSSSALMILGLEKKVAEQSGMTAILQAHELSIMASQTGSAYGLVAEARARIALYRREPESARAANQLGQAAVLIRMAAMLGDHQATLLGDDIPVHERLGISWSHAERTASLRFQRMERVPTFQLRRSMATPRPFPEALICEGVAPPFQC